MHFASGEEVSTSDVTLTAVLVCIYRHVFILQPYGSNTAQCLRQRSQRLLLATKGSTFTLCSPCILTLIFVFFLNQRMHFLFSYFVQFTLHMFRPWLGHHQGYIDNICRVHSLVKKNWKININMHGEHNVKWIHIVELVRVLNEIWQSIIVNCFSVWQLRRTARHATYSTKTFCTSCSCVPRQTFAWSVDWASRTKGMTSANSQSHNT